MKTIPKSAYAFAVVTSAAGLVDVALARILAARDLFQAALVRADVLLLGAAMLLLFARLFLFLCAPGWGLYVVVTILTRQVRLRSRT